MERISASRILPSSIPYPPDLPIVARKDEIVRLISAHRVLVVAGATGSGKSTQIPKMCMEAGKGRKGFIGCTQPRRIAAIALARQVARELGPSYRHLVGYKVRFQDTTSPETVIKFLTDGMLLAEAQHDKLFRAYEVIMIDEAHERSLNIDLLIGMLRRIIRERDDLTVIVSSATIDPQKFADAFSESLGSEVPVIEIPSKLYPVEVVYRPWESAGDTDEWNYVDHAVDVVEELIKTQKDPAFRGDVLVFMPTERDIRETVQRLGERDLEGARVYPLYARQASWEQEKIFEPTPYRKVIVATNVAETSLTIPNVSFVVDTGLARISHYSPRTGIRSLPILPISRASADQRKGRCGRTGPGLCVRLYSEEDYLSRQEFTPPEIKRANLAEVILRMLALGLGDVESFPFLDPPHKTAVREGFVTLRQLGAIDDAGNLTPIGRTMARFPLDPRLSRIIIEARRRKVLNEVLIIVSALNVQDARKRPFGEEEAADRAHQLFADPRSDFLSLLNIWRAFHREVESGLSRTKQKDWCRRHYLSYRIMREWINVYEELLDILEELGEIEAECEPDSGRNKKTQRRDGSHRGEAANQPSHSGDFSPSLQAEGEAISSSRAGGEAIPPVCHRDERCDEVISSCHSLMRLSRLPCDSLATTKQGTWPRNGRGQEDKKESTPDELIPDYEAIHCSLLSGFLCSSGGLIAMHEGRGRYRGGRDKEIYIFPGSFVKGNPAWIMAAEAVETSRLFARYVAEIDPLWVEDVGRHLCHYSYHDPHWDPKRGSVVAFEKVTYQGLPIVENRVVTYGRINPEEARQIFIMEALVDGKLGKTYPFMIHNEQIVQELRNVEERVRRRGLVGDRDVLFRFYDSRLPHGIFDVRRFDRFMRGFLGRDARRPSSRERYPMDALLRITREVLMQETLSQDLEYNFPGHVDIFGTEFSVTYRFSPGSEEDGVTITVPMSSIEIIRKASREGILGWTVPGYLEEKLLHLLKGLPKAVRKELMPIQETVKEVFHRILPSKMLPEKSFWAAVSDALRELRGVEISPGDLARIELPPYLSFRVEIIDPSGKVRVAGRNIEELLVTAPRDYQNEQWEEVRLRFEKRGIREFPTEPIPDRIEVVNDPSTGVIFAYPGMVDEGKDAGVAIKLFKSAQEAQRQTSKGLLRLYEEALRPVISKYASSWSIPPKFQQAAFFMVDKGGMPAVNEKLKRFILSDVFSVPDLVPISSVIWDKVQERIEFVRKHLFSLGRERFEAVIELIEKRDAVRKKIQKYLERIKGSVSSKAVEERMMVMLRELDEIAPADFLEQYSFEDVKTAIGLLGCLEERVDRCYASPEKDRIKENLVVPHIERYDRLAKYVSSHPDDEEMKRKARSFRWLLLGHKALVFTTEAFQRRFGSSVSKNYSARALEEAWKECEKMRHGL